MPASSLWMSVFCFVFINVFNHFICVLCVLDYFSLFPSFSRSLLWSVSASWMFRRNNILKVITCMLTRSCAITVRRLQELTMKNWPRVIKGYAFEVLLTKLMPDKPLQCLSLILLWELTTTNGAWFRTSELLAFISNFVYFCCFYNGYPNCNSA